MGANGYTPSPVTAHSIQRGLGWRPPREAVGTDGVAVEGGPNPIVAGPPVGVGAVTFGVGAPVGTPDDGNLYFDTTLAVYVGYVGNGGVWNQF